MRDDLPTTTIEAVIAAGFDVYMPTTGYRSYLFFTDGTNIGYLQNDRLYGLKLGTVHIPNRTTGTGFGIDEYRGELTAEALKGAFIQAPGWASHSDRATVRKYDGIDHWLKEQKIVRYEKVTLDNLPSASVEG